MIAGKLTKLRALTKQDMPTLQKWMNDPDLIRWLGPRPPISLEDQYQWFENLLFEPTKKKFMIDDNDGHPIGVVSLMKINLVDLTAEFGIYLGEKSSLGKGYGKDATQTILRYGFQELGLIRIFLIVLEDNFRAIKSFEECGFKKEKVLKKSMFFDQKYHNQLIMGILVDGFDITSHQESYE
ncbi:MAG: GNAT family N-acetyltransferase [Anaerolineaceae bacterium]